MEDSARRDEVLRKYFTPESFDELSAIPLRVGALGAGAGLSVGDDPGSRIAGFWWGFPWERQVIVVSDAADSTIFHEYVHQAEYLELISRDEFLEALALLKSDPEYAERVAAREREIRSSYGSNLYLKLALWYDDGLTKEMVAHMAADWAFQNEDWPASFMKVYARAVNGCVEPAAATPAEKPPG